MNLIGCLDTPSKGEYYLNGKLVSQMEDDELAHIRNREIVLSSRLSISLPAPRPCTTWSFR